MTGGQVIRAITGFRRDDAGDWVAELNCLHRQHVRHQPPFHDRAWVDDDSARRARVGTPIECPLCDRAEIPDDLTLLRTAGPWDEATLPPALRRSHRTAEAVWGILKVISGAVRFRLETAPVLDIRLIAGAKQSIPPEVPHEVALIGPARLLVEFWGRAK